MSDFLKDFTDAMASAGLAPARLADIIISEKWLDYQLASDPKGKKKGFYILNVDGDFAFGQFGDRRSGETIGWHSKSKKTYTESEKLEWKRKQDQARKKADQEKLDMNMEAAKVAKRLWTDGTPFTEHSYLTRKKALSHGLRVDRSGKLLIPIYADKKLWNLQTISADGEKLFIARARKKGGYFPLVNAGENTDIVVICEGYATGDAIRQATGLPVLVAFDSGNLKSVAIDKRRDLPNARFVFAADNDQWTKKPDGTPWNPGREKAQEAAAAIGGAIVIWPEVDPDDADKRTDFNDIFVTQGAESVKNRIMSAVSAGVIGPEPATDNLESPDTDNYVRQSPVGSYDEESWKEGLIGNDKGLKSGSIQNMYLFIKHHPDFRGVFAYNEFQHNITLVKCPKWEKPEKFEPRRLDDVTITKATASLERFNLAADTNKVYKAIQAAALDNSFHPAQEYFNTLVWDGVPRLDTWLTYYLGCERESLEYIGFVGRKWLCAAVARIFEPGCKFDHVLVLEGPQGNFKSTSLRKLATFGRDKPLEYFTDGITIADIHNKDTILKLQGSIIIELSELSGFSKKDDDDIKRWTVLQYDEARMPYARESSRFKRQFVLSATTNRYDYLKDATGNRRYWPVYTGTIDIDGLERDKEQIWAEAVAVYKAGIYLGPTKDEEKIADLERAKRLSQDPWNDAVMDKVSGLALQFKIPEIMDLMGLTMRDKDERAARRISNILQINGYENKPIWGNGKTERFWVKK